MSQSDHFLAGETAEGRALTPIDHATAAAIVEQATQRYIAARHARVESFAERNFSLAGSLRLHRRAAGWDLLRAPANLALALPHLASLAGAAACRRMGWRRSGAWLESRRLLLRSDVAREIEWRLFDELLELPYSQEDRRLERDALQDEIFRDPRVTEAILPLLQAIGRHADDPAFRRWLADSLANYSGSRAAAADLATALTAAGLGALAFKQFTPGALSLGPLLAQAIAQHAAVMTFPLGSGLGALWYGAVPVTAPAALAFGVTSGLLAFAAVFAAFSGVITDPLQRRLGLHQRRLRRLIDCLERELTGAGDSRFSVRDHYAARLLDTLDLLRAAQRFASGAS